MVIKIIPSVRNFLNISFTLPWTFLKLLGFYRKRILLTMYYPIKFKPKKSWNHNIAENI